MPRLTRIVSAVVALWLATSFLSAQKPKFPPELLQRIGDISCNGKAIQVEDQVITYGELRRACAPMVESTRLSASGPEDFQRKLIDSLSDVVARLIDERLMVSDFKNQKMKIPPDYLDAQVERNLAEDFGGDRSKFQSYLDAQGMNKIEYKKMVEEKIIVSIMNMKIMRSQSEISPEKILSFYQTNKISFFQEERVRMSTIVLKTSEGKTLDALKSQALELKARIAAGEKFADLAKKYSMGDRASSGGDWEWNRREDLSAELSEQAFALQVGKVSEPFVFKGNVYLIYIEDRSPEGIQPLSEVRDRIEKVLLDRLFKENQERAIQRLRKKAFVRFY